MAGNCLPYHQPELLATKEAKKALGLSRFLFVGTWIPLTFVENSLGYLRSGFSGWNFLRFEVRVVSWFTGNYLISYIFLLSLVQA